METLDIGIITHHLRKGNGIDTSVVRFAKELSKKNNVTLISETNNFKTDIPFFKLKQNYSNIFKAHTLLNKLNFDILSSHFVPSNFIASRTKFFHVMHEPGLPNFNLMHGYKDKAFWLYTYFLTKYSLNRANIVFPISYYIKNQLNKMYNYNKESFVLPYGIDILDSQKRIDENFILFVGRHVRYKNIHTLFKIFKKIESNNPDLNLYTIGVCPDSNYYKKLVKLSKDSNIRLLGYIENVYDYLYSCNVYVNASLWEGQDIPVIEAQMFGKPVITFDNCSHPETNLTGYLAKNNDEFGENISKALDKKINNKQVKEKFSINKMVTDFENILKQRINK